MPYIGPGRLLVMHDERRQIQTETEDVPIEALGPGSLLACLGSSGVTIRVPLKRVFKGSRIPLYGLPLRDLRLRFNRVPTSFLLRFCKEF